MEQTPDRDGGLQSDDIVTPILRVATRIERLSDRHIFEPVGLSFAAFKILKHLSVSGPSSPGTMLVSLGGTKSNLSQRLGTLERKGFVKRLPPRTGGDRRFADFALTTSGKKKLRSTETLAEKEGLRLAGHFSKTERSSHASFFEKLLSLLDQAESGDCPDFQKK